MNLSFSLTSKLAKEHNVPDPLLDGTKTVSRRLWSEKNALRWANAFNSGLKWHKAWSHLPFVKGARCLGSFELICAPYQEKLADMPETDIVLEGGFWKSRQEFIDMLGCSPQTLVWVVRWENFQRI